MNQLGRWWLVVAVVAWVLVALGEVHHAFTPRSA